MVPHLLLPVHESSQIGDARRQAARLAAALDFNELALGRLALVVSELATNLVRHAREGWLLMGRYTQASVPTLELIAVDRGPGMRDVEHSMSDGVSTGGTSGTGLGAVQRLSSQCLVFSKPGQGTVIVARLTADQSPLALREPAALKHAGISVAAPAETVSGDSWALRPTAEGIVLLMADGLGHGPEAAAAADAAADELLAATSVDPADLIDACHRRLRSSRGAAVAAMSLDAAGRRLAFSGAGNVAARLMSGVGDRSLLSQHGTVGVQLRKAQTLPYDVPPHARLIVHSDGLHTRWDLNEVPELLGADPILLAAYLLRHQLRGRDDATIVVVHCP